MMNTMLRHGPLAALATLALLLPACGHDPTGTPGEALPGPGALPALLILDADAGEPGADGERLGLVFVSHPNAEGGWGAPEPLAADPRWLEPVALAPLPDGRLVLVESLWAPGGDGPGQTDPARGALFLLDPQGETPPRLWWSDARLRRPVAAAAAPDGTVYVSDRDADPLGLGSPTGAVFAVSPGVDGAPPTGRVVAAGPELITPGPLVVLPDGRVLLMDADRNPLGLTMPDGNPRTAGELYELRDGGLVSRLVPRVTVSPIGLVLRPPHDLFVVDANAGDEVGHLGDGAVFRIALPELSGPLEEIVSSPKLGRRRALVDPAGGAALPDGRLVIADANLDPLHLGEDGTGKGVYGTGHGAVLLLDPDAGTLELAVASERFVMPLDVCVLRP